MKSAPTKHNDLRKFAYQIAHDIQSPLAALNVIIEASEELSEDTRTILRSIASRINGIANSLLDEYKKEQDGQRHFERHQIIECAKFIDQLLCEKKSEYKNTPDIFIQNISPQSINAAIYVDPIQLGRSVSNLINNAVDALEDKVSGRVVINVESNQTEVMITITDNGIGMSDADVKKLGQRVSFTAGKVHGHGLGMTQVWDMLNNNDGRMTVESKLGHGTKITLVFARHWDE
ncbi:signal transduction histidine kinase [Oxalobacteraceae bacterium GrIS 2.11]